MKRFPILRGSRLSVLVAAALLAGVALAQPMEHGHGGHHGPMPIEQIDTDKDGSITRAEADAFAAAQHAGIDANGDGVVSYEEAKTHRLAKREEHARQRFADMDANGDGKVGVDELPNHAERMFEHLDANKDNVISAEELKARRGMQGRHGGH